MRAPGRERRRRAAPRTRTRAASSTARRRPGGKVSPASVEGRAPARVAVDAQRERRRERLAGGDAPGVGLGVGDLAVAVGVEVEARLEGRDLRLVDDDVEQDPVGLDPDPGVVVDREVAERVRGGDGGQQQHRERGEARERRGAAGAIVERASSSCGVPGHAAYLQGCGADPSAVMVRACRRDTRAGRDG